MELELRKNLKVHAFIELSNATGHHDEALNERKLVLVWKV